MSNEEVAVERLRMVDETVAADLGRLLVDLSSNHNGKPVPLERLESIVSSQDREQLVARLHGRLVGAATLNVIVGTLGEKAWLEDFVVTSSPDIRGRGVGYKLWQEIELWCFEKQLPLGFTSHKSRQAAHAFYARQGAEIVDTTVFRYNP